MPFKPGRTTRSMSPHFLSSVHDHPVPGKLRTIAPLPCLCRFIPFILLSSASNQGDRDSLPHSIPSKQRRRRIIGTWGAFALKFLNCIADVVVVVGTRPPTHSYYQTHPPVQIERDGTSFLEKVVTFYKFPLSSHFKDQTAWCSQFTESCSSWPGISSSSSHFSVC